MRMRVLTELIQGCSFSNTRPVDMSTCCQQQNCHFHMELVQYDQVQEITEAFPNLWFMDHWLSVKSRQTARATRPPPFDKKAGRGTVRNAESLGHSALWICLLKAQAVTTADTAACTSDRSGTDLGKRQS